MIKLQPRNGALDNVSILAAQAYGVAFFQTLASALLFGDNYAIDSAF